MNRQKGFSLIELLIVVAVIGIIAAIAVPSLVQSRNAANEASAISSVRSIVTAQITRASTVGAGSYSDLATLSADGFVDSVLGSGTKDGYTFASATSATVGFTATATPQAGQGIRGFYSDESAVIRWDASGTATVASTPLGGTPAPPPGP